MHKSTGAAAELPRTIPSLQRPSFVNLRREHRGIARAQSRIPSHGRPAGPWRMRLEPGILKPEHAGAAGAAWRRTSCYALLGCLVPSACQTPEASDSDPWEQTPRALEVQTLPCVSSFREDASAPAAGKIVGSLFGFARLAFCSRSNRAVRQPGQVGFLLRWWGRGLCCRICRSSA